METNARASLHAMVMKAAADFSTKVAVTFDDGQLSTSMTYKQMWDFTDKV